MTHDANQSEGADPSRDVEQQNPGGTTTADLTAGDKQDGDAAPDEKTKTQDLAKAGRDDLDPNAGQE
jgi:hypothetical protein